MNPNRQIKKALTKEVIKEINIKAPNQKNLSVIAVLLFSNPDLHEYINELIDLMKVEEAKQTKLETKQ